MESDSDPTFDLFQDPKVVMKIDIEGKELEVITDLILAGALADIDEIHVDWSQQINDPYVDKAGLTSLKTSVDILNQLGEKLDLQHQCPIEAIDDETYYDYDGPLPKCRSE